MSTDDSGPKVSREQAERLIAKADEEMAKRKEGRRTYYQRHREEILAKEREKYKANPEKMRQRQKDIRDRRAAAGAPMRGGSYDAERAKRYYLEHREEVLAKARARYVTKGGSEGRKTRGPLVKLSVEERAAALKEYRRLRYIEQRELRLEQARDNYAKNREARKDSKLKTRFGLEPGEYDRMSMAQGRACALCDGNNGARRLHVDHDHVTGKVRGLLCSPCNTSLHPLERDPAWAHRALEYLDKHRPTT